MTNKLYLGLAIIMILNILGTAMAISFNAKTEGSACEARVSGNYKLDGSTDFSISANLDSGRLFKEMKAKGSGFNSLDESVSTKENNVQNIVVSSGSMSTSSSSFGSNEGVAVNQDAELAGTEGFIGTKSVSPTNEMIIAGGFYETGDINERISSYSGEVAAVGGAVSSAGVVLLNDEISNALSLGDSGMSVEGISQSAEGAIGKFGLAAVNKGGKPSPPQPPTGTAVGPNGLTHSSDPTSAAEIMNTPQGSSNSYDVSLGWKIDSPLQLYLRKDAYLTGESLEPLATGKSIATAAATWEYYLPSNSNKDFFASGTKGNPTVIVSSDAAADKGDGYSVHAFKPIGGSAIAYARTWTSSGSVVESDVCYNTRLQWTLDWNTAKIGYPMVDVQSIALHELGHAVGLGDLYLSNSQDWSQIMNAYDDPQRYLGAGDIAGLKEIYGI